MFELIPSSWSVSIAHKCESVWSFWITPSFSIKMRKTREPRWSSTSVMFVSDLFLSSLKKNKQNIWQTKSNTSRLLLCALIIGPRNVSNTSRASPTSRLPSSCLCWLLIAPVDTLLSPFTRPTHWQTTPHYQTTPATGRRALKLHAGALHG